METNKELFLRRYEKRIHETDNWIFIDEWFAIYTSKGESAFLDKLEYEEGFTDFCRLYYITLRDAFNICSDGMYDYYNIYKDKFNKNDSEFRSELRRKIKAFDKYYSTAEFY